MTPDPRPRRRARGKVMPKKAPSNQLASSVWVAAPSNEQARAWNTWSASDDASGNFDPDTLGTDSRMQREYLSNRLWRAFMAGWEAAKR